MLIDAEPLPGYQEPYGLLCAILQDATNEWRLELAQDLDADGVVWQPHPGSYSIGALMLHMMSAEIYWFERFALGLPTVPVESAELMEEATNVDEWEWPTPPHQPITWYFEWHDRVRARMLENIKRWPAADTTLPHHGREVSLRWVLGHVIQHESYHGGQAVLLSRMWQLRNG